MTTPNAFLPPPPSSMLGGGAGTPMSPATPPVSQPNPPEKHLVHWFRKGLRMHDNPSLREGLKGCATFRCVFILDPWFATSNVGINKWRFLLQCLEDLDINLRKLNSRLFVIRGQPADILPKLFKEWKTTCLTFEEDPEPFGKVRDQNIMTLCKGLNIEVVSRISHTLYDLDQIIEKNGGKSPLTYHQFQSIVAKLNPPNPAEASVTPLIVRGALTPIRDDHDDKYGVPTLEELGECLLGTVPVHNKLSTHSGRTRFRHGRSPTSHLEGW
uniref:Cryptochrome-1 n=1 Tax=Cacopsylla melanoneura TaxID=428564 RepID=A0A8D8Q211_9HEMI